MGLALAPDGVQHARQRDVVDVVAGARGHRPVLAEPRHAPEHQAGVDLEQVVGAKAEAFHDAWPETFDQGVGFGHKLAHNVAPGIALDVHRDRLAAAMQDVEFGLLAGQAQVGLFAPVDADHLGAHIGEQHAAERGGADAGHLDDA